MSDAIKQNEQIYDRLWPSSDPDPHRVADLVRAAKEIHPQARLLEMGAGVLPRIPIEGGYFVDLSHAALRKLDETAAMAFVRRALCHLPTDHSMSSAHLKSWNTFQTTTP